MKASAGAFELQLLDYTVRGLSQTHDLENLDEGLLLWKVGLGQHELKWDTVPLEERQQRNVACLQPPTRVDEEEDSLQIPDNRQPQQKQQNSCKWVFHWQQPSFIHPRVCACFKAYLGHCNLSATNCVEIYCVSAHRKETRCASAVGARASLQVEERHFCPLQPLGGIRLSVAVSRKVDEAQTAGRSGLRCTARGPVLSPVLESCFLSTYPCCLQCYHSLHATVSCLPVHAAFSVLFAFLLRASQSAKLHGDPLAASAGLPVPALSPLKRPTASAALG